jgi:hypothetical protein
MATNDRTLVKISILENWYGIDRILFGDKKPVEIFTEKEAYSEFLSIKTSLLVNLFELYLQMGFEPNRKYKNTEELIEYTAHKAYIAKKEASDLIEQEEISDIIRKEVANVSKIEGLTEAEVVEHVVSRNYKTTSIDCLTLTEALEKACTACLSGFDGKTRLSAHKVLRDKLVNMV